jgi:hypothetical protein
VVIAIVGGAFGGALTTQQYFLVTLDPTNLPLIVIFVVTLTERMT